MKRACDRCIDRKVKCDGYQPCQRCVVVRPQIDCTYLKPAGKRGPKSSGKLTSRISSKHHIRSGPRQNAPRNSKNDPRQSRRRNATDDQLAPVAAVALPSDSDITSSIFTRTHSIATPASESSQVYDCPYTLPANKQVPLHVLRTIIEEYRARMYPVWPVIDVDTLLEHLQGIETNPDFYILITALCAATMVQLHLAPVESSGSIFTGKIMENECTRVRLICDYRDKPNLKQVLASFFLHVYHAKMDRRKAALVYVHESLTLARLLNLGYGILRYDIDEPDCPVDPQILYLLLWVSERGYAVQYALPISSNDTITLPPVELYQNNVYVQGLMNLAALFITFDHSHVPEFSRYGTFPLSIERLLEIEDNLSAVSPPSSGFNNIQRVDFLVTKQWMRILLWQQSMTRGLLSSSAYNESMSFLFPAQVARDLLSSTTLFSVDNLIPLGRDQLVKLFEITNSLADAILCYPPTAFITHRILGPPDFLHALYQTMLPLLVLDADFYSVLREKTANVLLRVPSRLFMLDPSDDLERDADSSARDMLSCA